MEMGRVEGSTIEEVHSLCHSSTSNIVRVITSLRLIWAGYVVRMEECRGGFKM